MAIRISRPVKAWVQMTYTSADSPNASGPGGWGVKETSQGLTPAMVDQLMSGVSTRLRGVPELSKFPSDNELEARSRRLAYRLVEGRVTLWHAVQAGNDASGRPGNVFAHVAAEPAKGTATRPIDYWRSTDWLVPFGAPEVAKARIPSGVRPDRAVKPPEFLDFISDGERLFVLRWLLDAVAWAVGTSSSVVLVTETADEAAGWIAAFSHLTAPQLGQLISFVTFERANTLHFATSQGFRVICVPRLDLPHLVEMQEPFLLLDPQWDLDGLDAAKRKVWTLPTGRSMPTTRWPEWALDLASLDSQDREHALAVLSATEQVGAQLPPGAAVPLHWPLSVAMMLDKQSVIMARTEKIQEILGSTPAELLELPACAALIDELVLGVDAESWQSFATTNRDNAALCELVTARLLARALASPSGTEPGVVLFPILLMDRSRAVLAKPVLEAVARADKLSAGGPDDVMEAARIASLLLSFTLQPVPENDTDIPALEPVIDRLKLQLRTPELASRQAEIDQFHSVLTGDSRSLPSAPPPQVAPTDPTDTFHEARLRDRIVGEMTPIFSEVRVGTRECAVLTRAVYVAAGIRPGVLPTAAELASRPLLALACANSLADPSSTPDLLLKHAEQIMALTHEAALSTLMEQPDLLGALETVLTGCAVLASLQQNCWRAEPIDVSTIAGFIKAGQDAHITALVTLFEPGPQLGSRTDTLNWAARMIVTSAQARLGTGQSVLTIATSGGDCLGWAVSRRLARSQCFSPAQSSSNTMRAELRKEIDATTWEIEDSSVRSRVESSIRELFGG